MKKRTLFLFFIAVAAVTIGVPLRLDGADAVGEEGVRLVLFKRQITEQQRKRIEHLPGVREIVAFSPYQSHYFSRLYSVVLEGKRPFGSPPDLTAVLAVSLEAVAPVASIETPGIVHHFSIRPAPHAPPITNDPLVNFQWALKSNGQQMILPKGTSIDSEVIHARSDSDLGLKNIQEELEAKIERDLVVGVLDFGLDYKLPDIVDGIAYNTIECGGNGPGENGKDGSDGKDGEDGGDGKDKKDRDGNGYAGDCLGWNVLEANNDPMDDDGHGTHVAGIIAGRRGNGLGISGISNKLKVIPIKVMQRRGRKKKKKNGAAGPFTDTVAKGILYAVTRGVDVINLSLGWPSSLDRQHIRQAIGEALKQGIMVVAAAGNNKNNRPIAPCHYPGVICVGSSRADKKVSSFSNFGAHVDVLAPGDQILGLFPKAAHNSYRANIFNIQGYEIKSGTSQAAPHVSAVAALIKGSLAIGPDQVKGRIFGSAVRGVGKGWRSVFSRWTDPARAGLPHVPSPSAATRVQRLGIADGQPSQWAV